MSHFTDLAKKKTAGSPVLSERSKISTDELIAKYPDGVTINAFDFLNGKNGKYVVCAFCENPGLFFNGGKILTEIFESFVDEYRTEDNTAADAYEACAKAFAAECLKVKLSTGRTKEGNRVTLVEVLDN